MKEDISLGELLLEILRFLRRNILILSVALVIGALLGSILENNRASRYESDLVLCSDLVENDRLKEILGELSRAVIDRNYDYLSQLSGMDASELSKLKSLDVKVIARAKDLKFLSNTWTTASTIACN